jgi:hypothetical protein
MSRQQGHRRPTVAFVLDREQLQEFAERGFVVVPRAIPQDLVTAGSRTIDALMERKLPSAAVRGHHFYWPKAVNVPSLIALLTKSPAFSLAESLTGPGTLDVPWQVQVALNIPPFHTGLACTTSTARFLSRPAALERLPCSPEC